MALTSDSQSSTNGANVVEQESAGIISGEDLEDGEIFEEEVPENTPESNPKVVGEVSAETILSNLRNSKPLLPTPKLYTDAEKSPKDNDSVDRNRRKRRSRDGEEEGEEEKKRRKDNKKHFQEHERKRDLGLLEKLEAEFGENDDDMIFARGISPMRHDEDIDRWEDEGDEEDDHRRRISRNRGPMRRDHGARGKRRGGRGGTSVPRKRKRDDSDNVCIFFMHGKCHRGGDCPYSHDAHPPRKMELCKFYMMDCCAKKDKCLYMHNDFPCKYYHTGLRCYAGKNCKFSHGKMNDTLRTVLLKRFCPQHLETAPKEILGEFPRISREAMTVMHGVNEKKIPSLFDIKVAKPANFCNNSNSDGSHTPMPSPTHQSQDSRNSDREPTPEKEERKERRSRERLDRKRDKKRDKNREQRRDKGKDKGKERRRDRGKEKESGKEKSKEKPISEEEPEIKKEPTTAVAENLPEDNEKNKEGEKEIKKEKESETVSGPSEAVEENLETVPAHLPKKQRELFLRIQQQQREANSSQTQGEDEDLDQSDIKAEDDWYSSDDEASPSSTFPSILFNLAQSANEFVPASTTVCPVSTPPTASTTTSLIPPAISNIDFSTVFKVLSSLQQLDRKEEDSSSNTPVLKDDCITKQPSPPEVITKKVDLFSLINPEKKLETTGIVSSSIPKIQDPPRARDPRLRNDVGGGDTSHNNTSLGDIDLRLKPTLQRSAGAGDVDLRNLPFKPVPVHSAANEIDASLSSHTPILYKLIPVETAKTDYTSLQGLAKPGVNDPRLRRALRVGSDETSCRDPRQRLGLMDEISRPKTVTAPIVADPRQRVHLIPQSLPPVLPTLATPRYDEDHRNPYFRNLDSDMRQFPPSTPRIEDDYVQNTSRSNDPRQRSFEVDPRRPVYHPARPYNSDTDLRPQLGLHHSQYNIK